MAHEAVDTTAIFGDPALAERLVAAAVNAQRLMIVAADHYQHDIGAVTGQEFRQHRIPVVIVGAHQSGSEAGLFDDADAPLVAEQVLQATAEIVGDRISDHGDVGGATVYRFGLCRP